MPTTAERYHSEKCPNMRGKEGAGLSGHHKMLASQAATSATLPKADCSIALCAR